MFLQVAARTSGVTIWIWRWMFSRNLSSVHCLFTRHALLDDPTGKSQHFASLLTIEWNESGGKQVAQPSLSVFIILSFCCQLPLCEFPKHTTALHYRCDIQMYCTFVLFVNQHFLGLPASGTHCICESCVMC
jgi:hypothetical protein